MLVAKKAKNAPPWTRKKLNIYRQAKLIQQREAEKAEAEIAKTLEKSGRPIDKAMEGCNE